MAEQLDAAEIVPLEEVVLSHAYEMSALIMLLEKKGILSRAEIIEQIKKVRNITPAIKLINQAA